MKRKRPIDGAWSQVAGHIDPSESAWQAALRELKEETDLSPVEFYSADYTEQFYSVADNAIEIVPVFVAFVPLSAEVVLNEEHIEFRWLGISDAIDLISFPGQRRMLEYINDEFVKTRPSELLRIKIHP